MDRGEIQRVVQRHRSPYTAIGWAFVKALRLKPRPPLTHVERRRADDRREVLECMGQRHGVRL